MSSAKLLRTGTPLDLLLHLKLATLDAFGISAETLLHFWPHDWILFIGVCVIHPVDWDSEWVMDPPRIRVFGSRWEIVAEARAQYVEVTYVLAQVPDLCRREAPCLSCSSLPSYQQLLLSFVKNAFSFYWARRMLTSCHCSDIFNSLSNANTSERYTTESQDWGSSNASAIVHGVPWFRRNC